MRSILIIFLFFAVAANAQPSIIVATGFATDMNKKSGSQANFKHIPVSVQWSPFGFKNVFLVSVDYFIPFSASATDYAYTLNPALPAKIAVQKSIRPSLYSLHAGARIPVYSLQTKNFFYVDALLTAINHQSIHVTYSDYDDSDYEILNPDISLRKTSVGISTGLVYRHQFTDKSSYLCMIHVQTPPFSSSREKGYDVSYHLVAPLQLTIGYCMAYRKNKTTHEKGQ